MKVLLMLAFMLFAELTKAQGTSADILKINVVSYVDTSLKVKIWDESKRKIIEFRIQERDSISVLLPSNKWYYIKVPIVNYKGQATKKEQIGKERYVKGFIIKQRNKDFFSVTLFLDKTSIIRIYYTDNELP